VIGGGAAAVAGVGYLATQTDTGRSLLGAVTNPGPAAAQAFGAPTPGAQVFGNPTPAAQAFGNPTLSDVGNVISRLF
jgi:hypothetical protein